MTTPTLAMTKLDAVNLMLASIGQSPLNTISGTIPKEGTKAVRALDGALREVLTQGWSFNSDREYVLSPSSGKINVPAGAAWIDPTYGEAYTMRYDAVATAGLKVYNNLTQSFTGFENDVKFDIIWFFEFEQIPQHARQYVANKAGRKFQAGLMASQILYEFTREMETESYATFRRLELRTQDFNINHNAPGAHRRFNPRR